MEDKKMFLKGRLSTSQKNANKKQWYKEKANSIAHMHNSMTKSYGGISDYKRMKVNYNLFNNVLDLKDFEYVCKPFGAEAGELPATMVNRDISSPKIKALLGMEMKRPFSWRVIATNPEATTRKEQEEFGRIRDFVVSEVTKPIRKKLELQAEQNSKGRELTEQEKAQIEQQIEKELYAQTPEETKKYMEREHQDPAEVLSHQLLEYLIQKTDLRRKFNTAFKHLSLSAKEVMYIGILNDEPEVWNINSLRVKARLSSMSPFIEDSEELSVEYRMTPSEVVQYFGDELEKKDLDKIYSEFILNTSENDLFEMADRDELFDGDTRDYNNIRVIHTLWRALRKIAFLTYLDKNGKKQMKIVDEGYKFNEEAGDMYIEYEWLPEIYETWIIGSDIYVNMRPVPGQFKDIDNLYYAKMPYYGVMIDDMNSIPTSPMDRLKVYQYYYNIVMYRLELLLASDKGKKVMMNINAIPDSMDIDIEKWQYFFESSPFMWFNPNEEGSGYSDVNTMAKTMDLSLASDIGKYIEFAEYLKKQAGASLGVTEAVEGQSSGEAVGNNRQNLIQTSHILEPYYDIHNSFKKNVLTGLLEMAKIAYSGKNAVKLSYVLDDMSVKMLELDTELLDNSKLGLFVMNSTKAEEAMQTIKQLAHAAMQNQKAELSDILSVIRQEGIVEAEETLKVAEKDRRADEQAMQEAQAKQVQELEKIKQQGEQQKFEHEKELAIVKEEERRKTEIIKASLMGASFNPDQDKDGDGVNDFIEIAKHGLDAEIKQSKNQLEREKFEHQKKMDKEKLSIEKKKLKEKGSSKK